MSLRRSLAVFVTLATIGFACSSFDEGDGGVTPPDRDAGGDDALFDGPLPDACSGRVLYVSGAGSEGNDGCSTDRPIKTISAALAFAAARQLNGFELRICGGVYAESGVSMTVPVTLRGGWNCVTWTRGPENVTRLENSGYPSMRTTLTIWL